MTNARGPQHPDARANFEALLEWGVLPMARADYSPMREDEKHTVLPARPSRAALKRAHRQAEERLRAFRPARRTKGLVVQARDIMNERGVV